MCDIKNSDKSEGNATLPYRSQSVPPQPLLSCLTYPKRNRADSSNELNFTEIRAKRLNKNSSSSFITKWKEGDTYCRSTSAPIKFSELRNLMSATKKYR